jgi:hypothetical protein
MPPYAIPVVVDEKLAPMSFEIAKEIDERFSYLRHYPPAPLAPLAPSAP